MPEQLYLVRALRKVSHDTVNRIPGDPETQDFWVNQQTRDLLVALGVVQAIDESTALETKRVALADLWLLRAGSAPVAVVDGSGINMGFVLAAQVAPGGSGGGSGSGAGAGSSGAAVGDGGIF